MDVVCDGIVEEILLRLPLKHLHRLRAVSRRYNALVLDAGFAARYWRSHGPHLSGVFLQTEALIRPWGHHRPLFLTAPGGHPPATESVVASDLGFLPHLPQLYIGIADPDRMIFIAHSSAGLLLCCRGEEKRRVHYYVCNPVTWQMVALPELPWPGNYIGLLSVAADEDGSIRSFQVVLVNCPRNWKRQGDHDTMCVDIKMFSSDTGQWRAMKLRPPYLDVDARSPPFLGQSGTAYWIGHHHKDRAIAYDSVCHSVQELPVPTRNAKDACNRCLGELQGGRLRYAHFDFSVFEMWDLQKGVENGVWWKPVHRIGVMELAQQNPEVTDFVCHSVGAIEGLINRNSLFTVTGFHPTEDIVFLDVGRTVAAYSFKNSTIRLQAPRQVFRMFPYVHPPHPILIPEIKKLTTWDIMR